MLHCKLIVFDLSEKSFFDHIVKAGTRGNFLLKPATGVKVGATRLSVVQNEAQSAICGVVEVGAVVVVRWYGIGDFEALAGWEGLAILKVPLL